jgi:hypothetical protein
VTLRPVQAACPEHGCPKILMVLYIEVVARHQNINARAFRDEAAAPLAAGYPASAKRRAL